MEIKDLVDVTSIRVLCGYLCNDPEIHLLIDVKDQDLPHVAEIMIDGTVGEFQPLLIDKKIEFLADSDFKDNEMDMAVDCIRVLPFYIFKRRNQTYM